MYQLTDLSPERPEFGSFYLVTQTSEHGPFESYEDAVDAALRLLAISPSTPASARLASSARSRAICTGTSSTGASASPVSAPDRRAATSPPALRTPAPAVAR